MKTCPSLLIVCLSLFYPLTPAATASPSPASDDETVAYADALANAGMNDYAELVLARGAVSPDKAEPVRFKNLLSMNKVKEARAIIASKSNSDALAVWQMRLALANACFAWGQNAECRSLYDRFLKRFSSGPTEEFNTVFRDAAYRYGQMLESMGDRQAAAAAYRQALKAKLDEPARRQILTETAQTLLKLAQSLPGAAQQACLKEVTTICDELVWKQDIWFGHAIVMMAHVKLMQNDTAAAMEILQDKLDIIEDIDRILRQEQSSPPSS